MLAQASAGEPIQDIYAPRSKYALLIGNRDYPNRKDIAPAHKNVTDLKETSSNTTNSRSRTTATSMHWECCGS
jgi:hypothetical protein